MGKQQAGDSNIGLYYPFIHFKDDNWLKLSALYWDKMARIVPMSYPRKRQAGVIEGDSRVAQDLAEIGFVRNLSPEAYTYSVGRRFLELIEIHGPRLRKSYDLKHKDRWPEDKITALYAELRDKRLAYVYAEKINPSLFEQLQELNLAAPHNEGGNWLGMHPKLADIYMSALAEEMADENRSHPATDETLHHVAAAGWTVPRLAAALLDDPYLASPSGEVKPNAGEIRASLAVISFEAVMPKDLTSLTVEKIARIRERFKPERYRFQELVDSAAQDKDVGGPRADPTLFQDRLREIYARNIEPKTDELREALSAEAVKTVQTAASTSVRASPLLAGISLAAPVALLGALAYTFIPLLLDARSHARATYNSSPGAYLYRVDQAMKPRKLVGWVAERAQQFLVGI